MPKDWEEQQIVHMMAQWSPLGLELFHTDAWGTPEIHPSAAAEILAGAYSLHISANTTSLTLFPRKIGDPAELLVQPCQAHFTQNVLLQGFGVPLHASVIQVSRLASDT